MFSGVCFGKRAFVSSLSNCLGKAQHGEGESFAGRVTGCGLFKHSSRSFLLGLEKMVNGCGCWYREVKEQLVPPATRCIVLSVSFIVLYSLPMGTLHQQFKLRRIRILAKWQIFSHNTVLDNISDEVKMASPDPSPDRIKAPVLTTCADSKLTLDVLPCATSEMP